MSAEKDKEICAVVNLADTLARSLQLGNGGDLFIPAIQSEVWDFLDMDESKLKLILQNAKGAVEKASIFMQVI